MNLITLSEDLKYWRAERPDEWTMDRFIRAAEKLERSTIHNKDYAELEKQLLQAHKDYGCELRDPNGTIWEYAKKLEKQRDDLLQFVEWVLAETVRQRYGEGGDLRTIQHTAEALLTRIKDGEK